MRARSLLPDGIVDVIAPASAFDRAAFDAGIGDQLKLNKTLIVAKNMRALRKSDMIHNGATPKMSVDPETYEVRADGELLVCEAAATLPMAQRYFLF